MAYIYDMGIVQTSHNGLVFVDAACSLFAIYIITRGAIITTQVPVQVDYFESAYTQYTPKQKKSREILIIIVIM